MKKLLLVSVLFLAACGDHSSSISGWSYLPVVGLQGPAGTNGTNGQDATISPYDIVGIVDPCGTNPALHNEVFLKLENGTLVASFSDSSNGNNTRFSVLTPGNYVTTDGDNCTFTVTNTGTIINENHHF